MIRHVLDTIESFGLNPDRMMVEITESTMLSNERVTAPILEELHSRGLKVAVDDFGTGHSSLSRLTQMHVTTLKIDRAFIADLPDERERCGARPIDHPARPQPRPPAARRRHRDRRPGAFLTAHGCSLGQGFLYSPAVPADQFTPLYHSLNRAAA